MHLNQPTGNLLCHYTCRFFCRSTATCGALAACTSALAIQAAAAALLALTAWTTRGSAGSRSRASCFIGTGGLLTRGTVGSRAATARACFSSFAATALLGRTAARFGCTTRRRGSATASAFQRLRATCGRVSSNPHTYCGCQYQRSSKLQYNIGHDNPLIHF